MLKKARNKILKFLFGDDIFISYARADGGIYATGLANELVKENFSCEFDSWGTESGKDIPDSLTTSLKRCSVLVIIGTESAAQNNNVKLEIEMFAKTGRPIIPIIFEGVELTGGRFCRTGKLLSPGNNLPTDSKPLTKAIWADLIAGQSISCESDEALEMGDPSDRVVNRISKSYKFARRDQRLKKASLITTGILFLLMLASVAAGISAFWFLKDAKNQKEIADRNRAEAEGQQKRGKRFLYATNMWQASNMYIESDIASFNLAMKDASHLVEDTSENLTGFEWKYLNRVAKGLVDFNRNDEVAGDYSKFSPDGKYLATWGFSSEKGHLLNVWDTKTGEKIKKIGLSIRNLEDEKAYRFAFSPNSKWLAVYTHKDNIRIWNTSDWTKPPISKGEELFGGDSIIDSFSDEELFNGFSIADISFNEASDELRLLGVKQRDDGENNYVLWLWNFLKKTQKADKVEIKRVGLGFWVEDLTSDGSLLVSYEIPESDTAENEYKFQTQVSILDLNVERKLIEKETRGDIVYHHNITRNNILSNAGRIITSQQADIYYRRKGISVWDINDKTNPPEETEGRHVIALSPNGKLLAVVDEEGLVFIWDIENKKIVRKLPTLNFWNAKKLSGTFSPDSSKIVITGLEKYSGGNGFLTLWDVDSPEHIFDFNNEKPLAVLSDGTKVITWQNANRKLSLWDTRERTREKTIRVPEEGEPEVQFSPDGSYFNLSLPETKFLQVWKTTGEKINTVSDPKCDSHIAYSSDSEKIARLCGKDYIRVSNLSKPEELKIPRKVKTNSDPYNEIVFILDDKKIVNSGKLRSGTTGRIIEILDVEGSQTDNLNGEQYLTSSPFGNWIVTRDWSNGNRLLRKMSDSQDVLTLSNAVAFSDDGKILSVSKKDSEIIKRQTALELIKIESLPVKTKQSSSQINHLQLSPTERWMIGIKSIYGPERGFFEYKNTFIAYAFSYWDLNTGKLNYFRTSEDCLINPTFSPDDKRLITHCTNGTILLWDLEIGQRVLKIKVNECRKTANCLVDKAVVLPEGKGLLTVSDDEVKFWTTEFYEQ